MVSRLINVLRMFSIDDVLEFEENFDEQYKALRRLYHHLEDPSLFLSLVILNAIISYQLNCRGEEYWQEFSVFFSRNELPTENPCDMMLHFLERSKCNKRLVRQKIARIHRACGSVIDLCRNWHSLLEEQTKIVYVLAEALQTSLDSKTVVFAVKMANYGLRIITNRRLIAPMEVDIPLDSRIARITKALKIGNPKKFWREISRRIGIPPLHIDSLLWIAYKFALDDFYPDDERVPLLIELIRQLISQI